MKTHTTESSPPKRGSQNQNEGSPATTIPQVTAKQSLPQPKTLDELRADINKKLNALSYHYASGSFAARVFPGSKDALYEAALCSLAMIIKASLKLVETDSQESGDYLCTISNFLRIAEVDIRDAKKAGAR